MSSIQVNSIKRVDGTESFTVDSDGSVTFAAGIDVSSGTIDGVVIGGSAAAAGTFTTFTSTGIDDNASSTAVTINSSGNVGIGTTNPVTMLEVSRSSSSGSSGGYPGIRVRNTNISGTSVSDVQVQTNDGAITGQLAGLTDGVRVAALSNHYLQFMTNSIEHMRIDTSGNLLVGKTTTATSDQGAVIQKGVVQSTNLNGPAFYLNRQSSDGTIAEFRRANSAVGTISVNSSGTTYNTTSDARLKTDIQSIPDATDKIHAMNPVIHKWIADPEADAVHGFIAQEMQDVIPEAVSGDAKSDEMMSMDYGRITPVIVAALQDALKEIEELKTRINELEAK